MTVTLTECDRPPGPSPVTVIVYVPMGVVDDVGMFSVAVAEPLAASVTLDGDTDGTKPGDETVEERPTDPAKPLRLDRVTATVDEVPRRAGKEVGLAAMLKS